MEQTQISFIYDLSNVSLAAMIAAGKYDWVDAMFTEENFPLTGSGEVAMPHLHYLGNVASSEKAVLELAAKGLRPATLLELLRFGAEFPDEQKKYPIVALDAERVFRRHGSRREVPVLGADYGRRFLRLELWGEGWYGDCSENQPSPWMFAVVPL